MRTRRSLGQVYLWPLVIGVASVLGLVSALVSDGIGDALSWALLAVPVAVGLIQWQRR